MSEYTALKKGSWLALLFFSTAFYNSAFAGEKITPNIRDIVSINKIIDKHKDKLKKPAVKPATKKPKPKPKPLKV